MNVFEFIFFAGLVAVVIFGSKELGHLFGINAWVFAIPFIAIIVLALRWIGNRLRARRMKNPILHRKIRVPPKDESRTEDNK